MMAAEELSPWTVVVVQKNFQAAKSGSNTEHKQKTKNKKGEVE